jgi:serine/threonine-protein kinase HipA
MSAPDLLNLLDYVIFNVLVCNTDSHAKNYAILISGKGFKLAPMYDVMCAAAWEGITSSLPQKIAGKNRGDHIKRRHWESFASECGLNPSRVVARVAALAELTRSKIDEAKAEVIAMPAGDHFMLQEFCKAIDARIRRVIGGLTEGEQAKEPPRATSPLKRQRKPKAVKRPSAPVQA